MGYESAGPESDADKTVLITPPPAPATPEPPPPAPKAVATKAASKKSDKDVRVILLRPGIGYTHKDKEEVVRALLNFQEFRHVIDDPPGHQVSGPDIDVSVLVKSHFDFVFVRLNHASDSEVIEVDMEKDIVPFFKDRPFRARAYTSGTGFSMGGYSYTEGPCSAAGCSSKYTSHHGSARYCYNHRSMGMPSHGLALINGDHDGFYWCAYATCNTRIPEERSYCSNHNTEAKRMAADRSSGRTSARLLCMHRTCAERVPDNEKYCTKHKGIVRLCHVGQCRAPIDDGDVYCADHAAIYEGHGYGLC